MKAMRVYEQELDRDPSAALLEGSMHFEEKSAVHQSLRAITQRMDELGIPYAVVDGMAMFMYGFRRFTEAVDLLVTPEGLREVHQQLDGLGYVPPFKGSKQLRDASTGVRIEFLVTGQFPGDGKPKPVAFPDPVEAAEVRDGIKCLKLDRLVELKLASGMTNPARLKDLADVQELIRVLGLMQDFEQRLSPFVRSRFRELWTAVHENPSGPT